MRVNQLECPNAACNAVGDTRFSHIRTIYMYTPVNSDMYTLTSIERGLST